MAKLIKKHQVGGSIVDYLNTVGIDSSKENRKRIAAELGIENYDFSASKNLELLAKLRSIQNYEMINGVRTPMPSREIVIRPKAEPKPKKDPMDIWTSYYLDLREKGFTELNAAKQADSIMKGTQGFVRTGTVDLHSLEQQVSQESKARENAARDRRDTKDYQDAIDLKEHMHQGAVDFWSGAGNIYLKGAGLASNLIYYPIAAATGRLTDQYGGPREFSWRDYGRGLFHPDAPNTFADQLILSPETRRNHPLLSAGVATLGDPMALAAIGGSVSGPVRAAYQNAVQGVRQVIPVTRATGGIGNVQVGRVKVIDPYAGLRQSKKGAGKRASNTVRHHGNPPQGVVSLEAGQVKGFGRGGTKAWHPQNPAHTPKGTQNVAIKAGETAVLPPLNPVVGGFRRPFILPLWGNISDPIPDPTPTPNFWGSLRYQKAFREAAEAGLDTFNFGGKTHKVEYGEGVPGQRHVIQLNDSIPTGIIYNPTNQEVNYAPDSTSQQTYFGPARIDKVPWEIGSSNIIKVSLDSLLSKKKGGRLVKRKQMKYKFKESGKNLSFEEWFKTIPEDKSNTTNYNLRRAYELAPKEELERFVKDPDAHLNSFYFNSKTGIGEFVKSPDHSTIYKEFDFYNGDSKESLEFREKYYLILGSDGYHKYIPKEKYDLIMGDDGYYKYIPKNKTNEKTNIEVEGGEILLQSKEGHYAVIPAKHRQEVMDMVKDGCDDCINSYIQSLPKENDYAEGGSLLPDWDKVKATLNPKNWGVTDYSQYETRGQAYAAARKAGETEFLWNNKRFSTDNPKSNILNKIIANNIYPYGDWTISEPKYKMDYDELMQVKYYNEGVYTTDKKLTRDDTRKITRNEKGESIYDLYTVKGKSFPGGGRGPKDLNASYDALSLFNNQPQKYNSFVESKYKPSDSKNTDAKYYSFNDKYQKQIENDLLLYDNRDFINSEENKRQVKGSIIAGASLKAYQYSKGQDSKGKYIAYYDINDYGNILDIVPNTNPFEIYGRIYYKDYSGQNKRMYYSDKELSELNVDKKDFDTLALQRELSNRGYKLPKSTKEDGDFDGIWGDETKNALLDYQSKNNYAEMGLTNATKGTDWKIVKDFKGQPKHSQGGVDITISDKGVTMRRGGKDIKAKFGLLIAANGLNMSNPDKWNNKSRAHRGAYSKGLSGLSVIPPLLLLGAPNKDK